MSWPGPWRTRRIISLSAQYHRLARRRGKYRAILAVAHSILVIIYHVLKTKTPYRELGADYFEQLDTARLQRRAVQQLEHLGYTVALTPKGGAYAPGPAM